MTPQHDPVADPARWDGLGPVTSRPEPTDPDRQNTDRDVVLGSAFDNAPVGMAVLTPVGVVTMCNAALGGLLGRTSTDLVGTTFFEVTHPEDLAGARRACARLTSGDSVLSHHECRFVRPDGVVVWVSVKAVRVPDGTGHPAHVLMHIEDISERKAFEAGLVHRALHDPLTGLPNRVLLAERITHANTGRRRSTGPHCLFYLDLNGFKAVNDRYGHAVGDVVLQQLAKRIVALLRPEDTAARLGGDEFAVFCVDVEPQYCGRVADRLRAAAARPFLVDGHVIIVSAAVGVGTSAPVGRAVVDGVALLQQADRHMYEQKHRADDHSGPEPGGPQLV
jgi:diguanylate cyclase (GGDEF)-like protein/PAS domain S-box-containing protein